MDWIMLHNLYLKLLKESDKGNIKVEEVIDKHVEINQEQIVKSS